MKHRISKIVVVAAVMGLTSPLATAGLLSNLIGKKPELHELQLEQAIEDELFAQAHICKALGGSPREIEVRSENAMARGLECLGQKPFVTRIELEALQVTGARLLIETEGAQAFDTNTVAAQVRERRDSTGVEDAACNDLIAESNVRFECTGRSVTTWVKQYRPNRFAPWTDVAKARKAARQAAFGDEKK